jgi:hypothetical protein
LATVCIVLRATFHFLLSFFPPSLEFNNLRLSNPNIGAHHLCARENTHKMPPKKRPEKELSTEASSQAGGAQVFKTSQIATQPQTFIEPQQATVEVRRPEEPPQQPPSQAKVLAMNTSTLTTQHPTQIARHRSSRRPATRFRRGDRSNHRE